MLRRAGRAAAGRRRPRSAAFGPPVGPERQEPAEVGGMPWRRNGSLRHAAAASAVSPARREPAGAPCADGQAAAVALCRMRRTAAPQPSCCGRARAGQGRDHQRRPSAAVQGVPPARFAHRGPPSARLRDRRAPAPAADTAPRLRRRSQSVGPPPQPCAIPQGSSQNRALRPPLQRARRADRRAAALARWACGRVRQIPCSRVRASLRHRSHTQCPIKTAMCQGTPSPSMLPVIYRF